MDHANLLHYAVDRALTGDGDALRLLQQQRLVHPSAPVSIIADILVINLPHSLRQTLILPGSLPTRDILVKSLPTHLQHPAVHRYLSFLPAVIRLFCKKPHSLFFADFRRLAAKKALASAKNAFSSFSRRISRSNALFCLRSTASSSARLIASPGRGGAGLQTTFPYRFPPLVQRVHWDTQFLRRLSCFVSYKCLLVLYNIKTSFFKESAF